MALHEQCTILCPSYLHLMSSNYKYWARNQGIIRPYYAQLTVLNNSIIFKNQGLTLAHVYYCSISLIRQGALTWKFNTVVLHVMQFQDPKHLSKKGLIDLKTWTDSDSDLHRVVNSTLSIFIQVCTWELLSHLMLHASYWFIIFEFKLEACQILIRILSIQYRHSTSNVQGCEEMWERREVTYSYISLKLSSESSS